LLLVELPIEANFRVQCLEHFANGIDGSTVGACFQIRKPKSDTTMHAEPKLVAAAIATKNKSHPKVAFEMGGICSL
jgi:hypothetical protein